MEDRYKLIVDKVSRQYPHTNFGIIEEHKSIHLVYDDRDLVDNKVFFNFACDIAFANLEGEELNIFAIVYDYGSELVTTKIITEVSNAGRYSPKDDVNTRSFVFNTEFFQQSTNIDERIEAA